MSSANSDILIPRAGLVLRLRLQLVMVAAHGGSCVAFRLLFRGADGGCHAHIVRQKALHGSDARRRLRLGKVQETAMKSDAATCCGLYGIRVVHGILLA